MVKQGCDEGTGRRQIWLTSRNSLALSHASSSNRIARVSSNGRVDWNRQRVYLANLTASKFSSTQISLTILRMVEYKTRNGWLLGVIDMRSEVRVSYLARGHVLSTNCLPWPGTP